ncbi:MAG TPA: polysaccharide deacetylase family protein [Actinomycetota bacterium]|nr:polysaccharide deacetylase family protein [Actinomycetota bacterium]
MRRTNRVLSLILGTLLGIGLLPPAVAEDAMPMRVTLESISYDVEPGTTVGALMSRAGVETKRANLVSLKGRVLSAGTVEGRILVDGVSSSRDRLLEDGDAVVLEAAADRKESATRSTAPAAAVAGNPVRGIPANYGVSVITFRGTVSGETVRVVTPAGADKKSAVAITFDDGPDPTFTPQILAILNRYKVKATFFWTGRNIARYPKIVAAARAAGHSIQNHTWNHENLARAGFAGQEKAIVAQTREMRKLGLPFPKWMRPPYGSFDPWTLKIAAKHGMRTILWTIDTVDYRRPPAMTIAKRVLGQVRPGSVVLMHDGGGSRAATVEALPIILDALLKRGYRPVAL